LKDKLEPWSQSRILETIDRENRVLGDYEEQVKNIEAMITEAISRGIAETPDIEECQEELVAVRGHIQEQRNTLFQINVNEAARQVEVWLQKLEDIEALLQTSDPVKNIPEFLNQVDTERQAIEKDLTFDMLQALIATTSDIRQRIGEMKPRIQERLFAASRKGSLKQGFERLHRQHQVNKYIIPVSLAVALITGGLLEHQIQASAELTTVRWIALALLIAYFLYYVLVFYIFRTDKE
jgi:hypothetical protein